MKNEIAAAEPLRPGDPIRAPIARPAALLRQNAEHAEIILAARKRLIEIAEKLGRKTPWSQGRQSTLTR